MSESQQNNKVADGTQPVWSQQDAPVLMQERAGDLLVATAPGMELDPIREIRAFHRFHFRLTMLYGSVVIITLALLVLIFYNLWSKSEIESLQQRLLTLSTSLAATINADQIAAYDLEATTLTPFHQEIYEQFKAMAERDKDIDSIYILRPSNVPTELFFFIDYAKGEMVGDPGQFYSAEDTPIMLKGFSRPAVENIPYRDEFGYTLSAYAPLRTAGEAPLVQHC